MSTPLTVVLIEDERGVRRFLSAAFGAQDVVLVEAETAKMGLAQVASHHPDVVLLDLGLPDGDGIDVVRAIREWSDVPIIILSARGRETDKVAALNAGADDYLTKPFGIEELLARMRTVLRRSQRATASPLLTLGPLQLDLVGRVVRRDGNEVHLTPTEFRFLAHLAQHIGKVVTHRQLLKAVWGLHTEDHVHYLRVYAAQLRQKLEDDPSRPRWLITEPGVGYRLREE